MLESPETTYVRRLERLLEASRLLNSTLELTELTKIVLQIVADEVPVDRCTLFVVDRSVDMLRSFVAQGVDGATIDLPLGKGLAGTVALTGETLDIPDVSADPRFQSRFDEEFGYETKDIFCMPILNRHGEPIGVLELLNRRRDLTDADREFLSSMCTYIDLALQNAWIHHELLQSKKLERELREVSERLAHAEKLCELNALVAGIVHEMKNPLTVALGHCGLLREEHAAGSKVAVRAEKIKTSMEQALKVAKNFLNVARPADGDCTPTDINVLVRQTADLLAHDFHQRGVSIALDLHKVPSLTIDPAGIQQVLLNLLRNAQQAAQSKKQGNVAVRTSHDEQNDRVRVLISDNGPGIAAQLKPKIFEPFFTTKPRGSGTGLGLAVSKRIIEQHAGKLSFESKPGSGTTFAIELSVAAPSSSSKEKSA